jgi:hypothetical protein
VADLQVESRLAAEVQGYSVPYQHDLSTQPICRDVLHSSDRDAVPPVIARAHLKDQKEAHLRAFMGRLGIEPRPED